MRGLLAFVIGESVVLAILAAMLWEPAVASGGHAPALRRAPEAASTDRAAGPGEVAATGRPAADHGSGPERSFAAVAFRADDPAGIVLQGTVRSRDGGAVRSPSLWLAGDARGRSANATDEGHYACAGLAPGTYDVTIRADGFADHSAPITLDEAAFQTRDFELSPAWPVAVRLETPDGQDVNQVLQKDLFLHRGLHVVGDAEPFPDRLAVTDYGILMLGSAQWRGEDDPKKGRAGVLWLAAPPPAHTAVLLRSEIVARQQLVAGQKEATFVIDPAAVRARLATARIRLVDAATGQPLEKVRVELNTSSSGGGGKMTGADGRIVLENLLPGELHLSIYAKDYENVWAQYRFAAGETRDLGELRLARAAPLTGRTVDADGKPVPASLAWTELKWRSEPREFAHNRSARGEADGTFSLWGTGPGRIAIQATAADGRMAVGVFDNPPAAPVELVLREPATVVVTRSADPAQTFTLTMFDAENRPVQAWNIEPRPRKAQLRLPPGTYGYEVRDGADRTIRTGSVTLGSSPATIELP